MRWKKNITTLENPLDALLSLRGVSYEWKDTDLEKGRQIGFIAQEVEKIFPELVKTDEKGYKSVNYIGVVPVLVEAVKAQNKKIDILSKENNAVQKENSELKAVLADVLKRLAKVEAGNRH